MPPPEFGCVMKNVQSGTVMHEQLFTERGHFIFIGCELGGCGDDKTMVKMRLADEPMGPWFGEASLFDLNTANSGNKGVRFGVHAHTWASDLENGEIMVSWTEPWPGSVEMARVKLAMQPMDSTATTTPAATTTIVQSSRHRRKNARVVISDCFEEEPIPEDPEPEPKAEEVEVYSEVEANVEVEADAEVEADTEVEVDTEVEANPEVEVDPALELCKREKARNKALAKLAGVYNREEDSDADTESVFDFKTAFQNIITLPGRTSPSSFTSELSASSIIRPYSGYDLRTPIPDGLTGSWILEEGDCHYSDDAFDDNPDSLDEQIPTLEGELEEEVAEEVAEKGDNYNSGSTTSSPQSNNHHSSFWLQDSDTNTEYSASVSHVSSSPITATTTDPTHHYHPSDLSSMHLSPSSPPLPGIDEIMGGVTLSVFDTHSSSQTATTAIRRGGKKSAVVKKLLWGGGKKSQADDAGAEGIVGGDGSQKKGWKNSIKKSAIAKFLMMGGGGGE